MNDLEIVFFESSDFKIKEKIGKGTFGEVFKAERTSDKKIYAAKIFYSHIGFNGYAQKKILREFIILSSLHHPSILKFESINFQSISNPNVFEPTLITEFLPNGSIRDKLDQKDKKWTPTKKYISLLGISDAMRYLHEHGIIHRDLKTQNILIDDNYHPRVCDFGLSRCFQNLNDLRMTEGIGSTLYMAPELSGIDSDQYDQTVDVYSFAIVAYEIITDKKPYFELGEVKPIPLLSKVIDGYRPKFTDDVTPRMRLFLSKCWSSNSSERPSFKEIFEILSSDFSLYKEDEVDKVEVNQYIDFLRKEREKREGRFVGDEKTAISTDLNSVNFKIFEKSKIADIVDSPKAFGEVFIPENILFRFVDYKINKICDKAFANSSVESILIASSLKSIGNAAFENSKLRKLCIPKSLIKLEPFWCQGANFLNEFEVDPDNLNFYIENDFLMFKESTFSEILFAPRQFQGIFSVPEQITRIGCFSFFNRSELSSVISNAEHLRIIDEHSFSQCEKLKKVSIQSNESLSLCNCCFSNSKSLSFVELKSKKCISIANDAFIGCQSLEKITIEASDHLFGEQCFNNTPSLKEIYLKAKLIVLKNICFKTCSLLTTLIIMTKERIEIDEGQFANQKSLTNVIIQSSDDVTMGSECFRASEKLETCHIAGKKITISSKCFMNCYSLSTIIIDRAEEITLKEQVFLDCKKLTNIDLIASSNLSLFERIFEGTNLENINLNSQNVIINNECFSNCTLLSKLIFRQVANVTFGSNVFTNCRKLTGIDINISSTMKIGEKCFFGSFITNFAYQGSVLEIGSESFMSLNSLQSIHISSMNVTLGISSFEKCTNIKTIYIEAASELNICDKCFSECTNLDNIKLSSSLFNIGNSSFLNCSSMTSIIFQSAFEITIGEFAFVGCNKLTQFNINCQNNLTIGLKCFLNNSKINCVNITCSKALIGKSCFASCQSLKSFILQSNDAKLDDNSFDSCPVLENFVASVNQMKVSPYCFNNSTKLKNVKITANQILFCRHCFDKCSSLQKVECQSAKEIRYNTTSFNGKHYTEFIECPFSVKILPIKNSLDENVKDEKSCNIC